MLNDPFEKKQITCEAFFLILERVSSSTMKRVSSFKN